MKAPKITQSELQAAMEHARTLVRGDVLEAPPPGYFTASEYAAQHGITRHQAREQLERLVQKGELLRTRAVCANAAGVHGPATVYGLARK